MAFFADFDRVLHGGKRELGRDFPQRGSVDEQLGIRGLDREKDDALLRSQDQFQSLRLAAGDGCLAAGAFISRLGKLDLMLFPRCDFHLERG